MKIESKRGDFIFTLYNSYNHDDDLDRDEDTPVEFNDFQVPYLDFIEDIMTFMRIDEKGCVFYKRKTPLGY